MASKLKLYVGRKVIDKLQIANRITSTELKNMLQIKQSKNTNIEINLPLETISNKIDSSKVNQVLSIQPDDIIESISGIEERTTRKISFGINKEVFIKEVLENSIAPDENLERKRIIVEFSSPNIAKPFHVGHLRSTIVGNFIANLYKYLNHNVTTINYLGDWGTQFGLLKVGVDKLNYKDDDIKKNALKVLYESYVYANKLSKEDPSISDAAKKEFFKLENGSESDILNWKNYVTYSIDDLNKTYARLGIKFDEYNFESMYRSMEIRSVVEELKEKNILREIENGAFVADVNNRIIPIIKSDGTTLYLTRDIAAAQDRFKKYEFDRMFYVVDNSQIEHFNSLKDLLHQMGCPWVEKINHVKFGRIRGMSTRKGSAIFLKDVLDETLELVVKKQIISPTTKAAVSDSVTSDIIGTSCVIINDLKQRRQKDYDFNWDNALAVKGDNGIKLQYTHCRLYNLEKNCGMLPAKDCLPVFLNEPEVIALIREMSRFQEVLYQTEENLEACILVKYLFNLCNHINKAIKTIRVKDQEETLASQRLLLFISSRLVLEQGMKILGLQPLTKM